MKNIVCRLKRKKCCTRDTERRARLLEWYVHVRMVIYIFVVVVVGANMIYIGWHWHCMADRGREGIETIKKDNGSPC